MKTFGKFGIGIIMAVMLFFILACNNKNKDSALPTLTITRWAGPISDDQKEITKEYPHGTVFIDDTDFSNLKQKELLNFQSPVSDYDIIQIYADWMEEYVANDFLLPLDDLIKESDLDLNSYNAGLLDVGRINGKLYGINEFVQCYIVTYNAEWMIRENQKIPTTVDELVALAKYFKQKGTGIAMPGRQTVTQVEVLSHFLYSAGGDYYDANGNITLGTPEGLAALKLWDDLMEYAIIGSTNWHVDDVSQAVREGVAPFGISVSGLSGLDVDPEFSKIIGKVAYSIIPPHKKIMPSASMFLFGIPKNAKDSKASFELLKWMTSPDFARKVIFKNGSVTAVTSILTTQEVLAKYPFMNVLNETLVNGARIPPVTQNGRKLVESLVISLSALSANNNLTPEEVIKRTLSEFEGIDLRK
jgi:ABC-type glycerol-3-phosphate transport system substrate-binding protein